VAREDWVQKKDWPVNVDNRNKNKKYATYAEQEVAAMIQLAESGEEALIRFLVGTGFRIGEAAVAEWIDINCANDVRKPYATARRWTGPTDYERIKIIHADCLILLLSASQT
jgi:integrase